MEISTLLSIYNKPWLIKPDSAIQLLDVWETVKAGTIKWDYQAAKSEGEKVDSSYQIYQKFFGIKGVTIAPESSYDMAEFKGFEGAEIAVIPISGPLMKNDFCGSFGTNTLMELCRMAGNTESVKTILFPIDSPGGTVDGTEDFAGEIKKSAKNTIALCVGDMCSAAYWLGSQCDEVYASGKTNIIGCIGTMISLKDNTKANEARGTVIREYYATDSADKNGAVSEAVKGDGKKLIAELLDPLNDVFLESVREGRAGKVKEAALSGKEYTSENAIKMGLIDGIKSFESIVKSKSTPKSNSFILNKNKMEIKTLAELQAQAPEVYNAALKAGAELERKRINSWRKWESVDAEKVNKSIADGSEFDMEALSDLTEKKMNKDAAKTAEGENAPELKTAIPADPDKPNADKAKVAQTEFDKLCGLKVA